MLSVGASIYSRYYFMLFVFLPQKIDVQNVTKCKHSYLLQIFNAACQKYVKYDEYQIQGVLYG